MSRFRRYIVEATVNQDDKPGRLEDWPAEDMNEEQREMAVEVGKLIKKNCKEFIKQCAGKMLYRGYSGGTGGWSERTVRDNRYPKDTPEHIHDQLNDEFESAFGWPARMGVFCTGKASFAEGYGHLLTIWPKDGFEFVWSEYIQDLYADKNLGEAGGGDDSYLWDEFASEWADEYGDPREHGGYEDSSQGEFLFDGDPTGANNFMEAVDYAMERVWDDWLSENQEKIDKAKEYQELQDEGETDKADLLKDWWDQNFPYDSMEDYNLEDNEDDIRSTLWDEVANEDHGDFEWEPEYDEEEWIQDRIDQYHEDFEPDIYDIAGEYRDDDLEKAIDSGNEIMLGPTNHNYYAVDIALSNLVWDYAFGFVGSDDSKQMQFDFAFHPNPKIDKGVWKNNRFFAGVFNVKTQAIEYITTFKDLERKKKAWVNKPMHTWSEWGGPGLHEDGWVPARQLQRFKQGQSFWFAIPSDAKGQWKRVKFGYNYKFGETDNQKLARMLSMHVKLAT